MKKTPIGEIPVDWEVVKLGALAQRFINGGTPDTKIENYWDGDIPWITGADFANQKVAFIRRYISKEAIKNSSTNIIPQGSLLLVTRTGVGKIALAPFDIAISQDITGIVSNNNKTSSEYLFWALDFLSFRLKSTHQGTSINGILRNDLENFLIPLPPLPEQRKIAVILSSVDDAIDKTQTVIEQTKVLKKGMMQELLTRGIPGRHKKFKKTPIGEIPKEWEVVKLRTIADEVYRYPTYYNILYCEAGNGVPEIRGELIRKNGSLEPDKVKYRYIPKETSVIF
jgi:type I restriction enzyme S subunit